MLWGDCRGLADKSAVAAINRALRFTRKDRDPVHNASWRPLILVRIRKAVLACSRRAEGERDDRAHRNRDHRRRTAPTCPQLVLNPARPHTPHARTGSGGAHLMACA